METGQHKLLIFPCNGNGIEALDCIDPTEYNVIGFVDDQYSVKQGIQSVPVSDRSIINEHTDAYVLAVPGSPSTYLKRKEHIDSLGIEPNRFATVIHPTAVIGKQVRIGRNCLIMAGVVITSNAWIGDHVCVLPNTVIHHDVRVGDYSLIGSGVVIAGGSSIGENCYIGSGTNIINGIGIGDFSLVGIGSNVLTSCPSRSRIAGNPAHALPLKNTTPHG